MLPHRLSCLLGLSLGLSALAGCTLAPTTADLPRPLHRTTVWAVTDTAELVRVHAGQPQTVLTRLPLRGLPPGEQLVGLDFRVARGVLYALTSGGQLCTLDTTTGQLQPVGPAVAALRQPGRVGFDFNPVADRVRVVTESGQNLRLHPDTGAVAATDPPLQWSSQTGMGMGSDTPRITAAAYTYHPQNDKLTTNYAVDLATGHLLTQGTHESVQPAISPNTGWLFPVGALGTGPVEDAAFDISDVDNHALAALRQRGRTQLHWLDLATGRATRIGPVGNGQALWGLAIEP